MKVSYDSKTDTLSVVLREDVRVAETDEDKPGMILDFDQEGNLIALEILDASRRATETRRVDSRPSSRSDAMNLLFEDFVVVALRGGSRRNGSHVPQGARARSIWLDADQRIRLEPDLSWWWGDRCVFVGTSCTSVRVLTEAVRWSLKDSSNGTIL